MGEIRVSHQEGTLRTLLGSCLGVALWDRKLKIGALAHIVLPYSNGPSPLPGKFADTAVPEMVRLMEELARGERLAPTARIAGGANMFPSASSATVGERNIRAVEAILNRLGIPILGRHLGGEQGRRMLLDVASGSVTIEIVGAESAAI
jgi:chemotaxis protein CheD